LVVPAVARRMIERGTEAQREAGLEQQRTLKPLRS
jgi:hypothetical protein